MEKRERRGKGKESMELVGGGNASVHLAEKKLVQVRHGGGPSQSTAG